MRFRPITMTTMRGAGGDSAADRDWCWCRSGDRGGRSGIVVVGGLAFSQGLVTRCMLTPVIYTYFDELKIRFSKGHEADRGLETADRGPRTEDRGVLDPGMATASVRTAHSPQA